MRAALFAVLAIGCHHGAARVDNAAPPREGTAIAVYDRGDGTATEVVDDRRWLELPAGQRTLVLYDIDPAAALPSLVIEPVGAALRIGACRRDEVGEAAAAQVHERALQRSLDGELPEPTIRSAAASAPAAFAPIVTCAADGAPGRYLVRVLYVTAGLPYRAQHEVRMAAPDRATVRSTYTLATPAWHRTADVTVFEGAPGGVHVPRQLARGEVVLDGSSGAIVVPEREVKGRLRRIFDGAMPTSTDIASSDLQWGEGSREVVWVWLELADARIPPGPVHAILDLPNELARVSDIAIEARRADADDPDAPTRLAIYADEDLHGSRQRWHDFVDSAELADRFLMAVSNTGDEPREVWIEEHLRAAKRRVVAHAWPKPPGLHGEILRSKVVVGAGKTVRVGYTVDYDF